MAAHRLNATADTCYWGYLDPGEPHVLTVEPGDEVVIEAVTHHAGDAPDLAEDAGRLLDLAPGLGRSIRPALGGAHPAEEELRPRRRNREAQTPTLAEAALEQRARLLEASLLEPQAAELSERDQADPHRHRSVEAERHRPLEHFVLYSLFQQTYRFPYHDLVHVVFELVLQCSVSID